MINNEVTTQYNNFHTDYSIQLSEQDEISNAMFHKAIDFELTNKKLLDIGCGDGSALKMISSKGANVYGIDPSTEFLKQAEINNPTGIFRQGVGEALPFEANYFDVVVSKWAMQTSPDVPGILSEAARVLKPGGMFVFLTKHPIQQWLEKIRDYGHGSNYYSQQIVTSNIYEGTIKLKEPTHTIGEYFNADFFKNFEVLDYKEETQFPASEQFNNDIYPTFLLIKARKK